MEIFSYLSFLKPSNWFLHKTEPAPKDFPSDLDPRAADLTRDDLLVGLVALGANGDHLDAVKEVFKLCDERGLSKYIPYLVGSYVLMFRTSKPSPEHLEGFASFIIASLVSGIPMNKEQVYSIAALYIMKMKHGMETEDIPKALFNELCS